MSHRALSPQQFPPEAHVETTFQPWNGNSMPQPVAAAWSAMGAPQGSNQHDIHPERYEPNKGFGVHLKTGEQERRFGTSPEGVATERQVTPVPWADRSKHAVEPGMPMTHSDGSNMIEATVPGSEKPLSHVYRVMHEGEYQQAKARGHFKSDERMNLGDEGTVASKESTGSFYAAQGPNRIVRLQHRPEDGWKQDSDGYIKTHQAVPFDRADLVSPIIHDQRTPRGPNGEGGWRSHYHLEGEAGQGRLF